MSIKPLMTFLYGVVALFSMLVATNMAEAHTGHPHRTSMIHVHPLHQATAANDSAARGHDTDGAASITELSNASTHDQSNKAAAPCNGACCAAGSSCCTSAVTPVQIALAPPHLRGLTMAIRAGPTILGIDPEALPEPPKSFA